MACVEICPVGIEHVPIINQLRRGAVEHGRHGHGLQSTLETIYTAATRSASRGASAARWAKRADVRGQGHPHRAGRGALVRRRLRVVRPAQPARDPRPGEAAAGRRRRLRDPLRRRARPRATTCAARARRACSGASPSENIEAISACEFDRILTTDPHSFHTLRNEYPPLGAPWTARPVLHHSQLLARAVRRRRADDPAAARRTRHLPRPVHARPLQRRVRRAARGARADRLRAGRDAAQPRQLVLLRRRRRAGSG